MPRQWTRLAGLFRHVQTDAAGAAASPLFWRPARPCNRASRLRDFDYPRLALCCHLWTALVPCPLQSVDDSAGAMPVGFGRQPAADRTRRAWRQQSRRPTAEGMAPTQSTNDSRAPTADSRSPAICLHDCMAWPVAKTGATRRHPLRPSAHAGITRPTGSIALAYRRPGINIHTFCIFSPTAAYPGPPGMNRFPH